MLSASLLLFFLLSKTCVLLLFKRTQNGGLLQAAILHRKILRAIVFNRIQLHTPTEVQQDHLSSGMLTKQRLAFQSLK